MSKLTLREISKAVGYGSETVKGYIAESKRTIALANAKAVRKIEPGLYGLRD